MMKVVHLIPYDGVGGVESAARTMGAEDCGNIDFRVEFIFNGSKESIRWKSFNPLPLISTAWRLSRSDVDLLIVSLWRSSIVGLLAKCFRPRFRVVTFLHNSTGVHFLDLVFTYFSVRSAIEVWADSAATLKSRFPHLSSDKSRIVSFVARRFEPLPEKPVGCSFIYWGRISPQKGIDRAIRLFAALHDRRPESRFIIIGPDGGSLRAMEELCLSLNVSDVVLFLPSSTHHHIIDLANNASFFLQTSMFEGMAMSVVESMQLGLVPVVTPVGEIASYCTDGENAILVENDQKVIEEILHLVDHPHDYQSLRASAIATWQGRPLYRESILEACEMALVGHPNERSAA